MPDYTLRGPWIPRERDLLRRGELISTLGVPMNFAVVCADCEFIFHVHRITCPDCASTQFMPLETWLFTTKEEGT